MSKLVSAKPGDSLCSLAVEAGFKDCEPLRAVDANKDFLDRPLRLGDVVFVPDLETKTEEGKSTDTSHSFKRSRGAAATIRFVHGSKDKKYRDDSTLAFLNVSNYVTNKAGANGRGALPSGNTFKQAGHADPDTFKVEVIDLKAGGTVPVKLEAMKPILAASGAVTGHEPFTGAEQARRSLDLKCGKLSATGVYRSSYLRLVTDEEDKKTKPDQTLLVTDMADGLGAANDAVEILDQEVRATYELPKCPKSKGTHKCTTQAQIPVGPARQRIRVAVNVFRTGVGAAGAVGGLTEQMLRQRTFKWFRRAYAQAELAPKLVDSKIVFLDPPAANMLVISQDHGRPATGLDAAGVASTLSFDLAVPPPPPGPTPTPVPPPVTVTLTLTAGHTPQQVGQAVVAALPAGFTAGAHLNARAFNAANGSCDVMITRADGRRVIIRNEATTDLGITVQVARVNLGAVNSADTFNTIIPTTVDFRRVIRSAPGRDDQLDCFVIGQFTALGLRGRSFVPASDLASGFRPPSPFFLAAIMAANSNSGAVMDASDNLPFTFPHEAGHALLDAFHVAPGDPHENTEMMSGTGTSATNAVGATKRICDLPVLVSYQTFNPAQPTPGAATTARISAVQRLRARAGAVMEAW